MNNNAYLYEHVDLLARAEGEDITYVIVKDGVSSELITMLFKNEITCYQSMFHHQ